MRAIAVLALVVCSGLSESAGALLIDHFTASSAVQVAPRTPVDTDTTTSASFLGASRELTATWVSGIDKVSAMIDGTQLSFYLLPGNDVTVRVDWLDTTSKGTGADLTEGGSLTGIAIGIDAVDAPFQLALEVEDTFGNTGTASLTTPAAIGAPEALFVAFGDFGGGVDFSTVERVGLGIAATTDDASIQIDYVASAVPEPSTGLLLLAGTIGLALGRRGGRPRARRDAPPSCSALGPLP